jgi:ribonucleoside-diphosphate reductase alpha chain
MNYESKWCGASTGALVPINKLLDLRNLSQCELKGDNKSEYILGVDVARSQSMANNQTSIAVLKIKRSKGNNKIKQIQLVNIINLKNGLNFTAQAIEVKRIKSIFNAKAVIVDGNGLGKGLVDELLKETFDPKNGESLGCWNTINTEQEPEIQDAETILYDFYAQGNNNEVIVNFIDMVESQKLQLLEKRSNSGYNFDDVDYYKNNIMPYEQTDFLIEEVANLRLKQTQSGKYSVEQLTKRVDKDRYSSTAYALWYIKNFEDNLNDIDYDYSDFIFLN